MKKLLLLLVPFAVLLSACGNNEEEERQREAEEKARLESQVKELNNQASVIRTLLGGEYFVKGVSALSEGGGYQISFSDEKGNTLEKTVSTGTASSEIAITRDKNGDYYWTRNGQVVEVNGDKVRVNALENDAAPTVEFKLEEGNWNIKVGTDIWKLLGPAASPKEVAVPIKDVSVGADAVHVTLTNSLVLEAPSFAAVTKLQIKLDETAFQGLKAGASASTAYVVKHPVGASYTLRSYQPEGWEVSFTQPQDDKGTVSVSRPADSTPGKVVLVADGSEGSCFVKVLAVGGSDTTGTVEVFESVDAAGGSLDLPGGASSVQIPSSASWVKQLGTQLVLDENTTYDSRSADISFKVEDRDFVLHVVQAQKDAIVLTANSLEADPGGEDLIFVVQANVEVKASSDVDWMTVAAVTKGLEEKPFTVSVSSNETTETRMGTLTFTDGKLTQTVTVSQNPIPEPVPIQVTGEFRLVSSTAELKEGDLLLVVNKSGEFVMGSQHGKYRASADVIAINDIITDPFGDIALVTLEGEEGAWKLHVSDGYLAAREGSKNELLTLSEVTPYATWTISVLDGVATVKATAGERNLLCFSSQNARFSCYKSTSNGISEVALYKLLTVSEPVTGFDVPGIYLTGDRQRVYVPGADQYIRSYSGDALDFIILNPDVRNQVVIRGYAGEAVGEPVNISVTWQVGKTEVVSKQMELSVLKEEDGKLWLGDQQGQGVIIKK